MTKEMTRKYYIVAGWKHGFADTIEKAKEIGTRLAGEQFGARKQNVQYYKATINKKSAGVAWVPTGWQMYVPVRGTGKKIADIENTIRQQYKVEPMKWHRRVK